MKAAFGFRGLALAGALALVAATAMAGETIRLRRGLVVPVRMLDALSLRENRVDDRFAAIVEEDRDLPAGARLEGRVVDVRAAQGDKPGFMDLEFDTIIMPDESRQRIQAVPIRMDDKSIRRGGDGRFTAKKKLDDSSKHIVGGMIGGYLVSKILGGNRHEGVLLGALAGVILAEAERNGSANNDVVVKRESRMGALFERDIEFEWDERTMIRGVEIAFEDRILRFEPDQMPYRNGEVWMVPLAHTARQVGLSVDDESFRRILVEDDETVMILEQDSRNYRLNGKKGTLSRNVVLRNGVVFVPIDALSTAKIGHWSINGTGIKS